MSQEELFLDPGAGSGDGQGRTSGGRLGLVVTGVLGGSLLALNAVAAPFVAPALRTICLPFVPATSAQVIAAAKRGFQAAGFELNPWLVCYSRYKAWREGVHRSTSFHISDLWKVSFAQYSNVVIFGVPQMMDQLELKLASELPSTAKVVACRFPFPTWVPEHTAGEGIDTVWVYDAKTFKSHLQRGMISKTTTGQRDSHT
ncbi:ATP synthase subunit C lysine N-methyltransferase isoform X2 [Brachyistius frenatus]|uniref:ATP synthase subunit C lysine N-methyltransferase isoform X2 n=1 Tax=Brachyistius frenatus TaxID=100188 RepID=UPI0037E903C4